MYAERLEILLRALSSERLDFQGEFHVLTDARMSCARCSARIRPSSGSASAARSRRRVWHARA